MRRAFVLIALLSLTVAASVQADERAPSPREHVAKIVRIIKKIFAPAPQDELSWPHP